MGGSGSSCLTPNWFFYAPRVGVGGTTREAALGSVPDLSVRANERIMEPIPQTRFGDARGGLGLSTQPAARATPNLGPANKAGPFFRTLP